MDRVSYVCEDCGYEFEKTELFPDIEDQEEEIACPSCGGVDLQIVSRGDEPAA